MKGVLMLGEIDYYAQNVFQAAWTGTPNASTSTRKQRDSVTRTNLATNPSFATSSGTAAVRTNLNVNPRALAAGGGWALNAPTVHDGVFLTTGVPAHPLGITTAIRGNVKAGQTSTEALSLLNIDVLGTTGPARTIGVWVYSAQAGYQVKAANGLPLTNLTAGVWTFVTGTLAVNASAGVLVGKITGNAVDTDFVYATGCLPEANTAVLTYFDGATPAAEDFTYAWTGAVNASTSTQQALVATDARVSRGAGAGVVCYQRTEGAQKFARVSRPGTDVAATFRVFLATQGVLASYSGTFTVLMRARYLPETNGGTITPTFAWRASNGVGIGAGTIAAGSPTSLGAEWQVIRRVFSGTVGATEGVYWDMASVTGFLDVDSVLVVTGTYTGPYFDGATVPVGTDLSLSLADYRRIFLLGATGLPAASSLGDLEAAYFTPDRHAWLVTATGAAFDLSVSDLKALLFAPYA